MLDPLVHAAAVARVIEAVALTAAVIDLPAALWLAALVADLRRGAP